MYLVPLFLKTVQNQFAMAKTFAAITGVAGYVPEDILSNADLEKMVDTTDEWITTRTGIKERRILRTPGKATSDMAVEVVKQLLAKDQYIGDEIELLICATVTPDMTFFLIPPIPFWTKLVLKMLLGMILMQLVQDFYML
jgi:3-oxoacyl-[acyl-carrier-protein] synthase III